MRPDTGTDDKRAEALAENERIAQQLERALAYADGFALFYVVSPADDLRQDIVPRLRGVLAEGGRQLQEIELPEGCGDPLTEIESRIDGDPAAISVTGLPACRGQDGELTGIAHRLNIQRERWATKLPRAILLWLNEKTHSTLVSDAPDFTAWTRGIHLLRPVPVPTSALAERAAGLFSEPVDDGYLPLAEARHRLVGLQDLLNDLRAAEPTPTNRQAFVRIGDRVAGLLNYLSRSREALAVADDMLSMARDLSDGPSAVAGALFEHGRALHGLGRRDDALSSYEEALGIYRALTERELAVFEPDVATTLNNLGTVLSDLGRHEGALSSYEEALGIRRELAEREPAAFEPVLASTLNNMGNALWALGRREEALSSYEEALAIYRELAEGEPAAFEPALAAALNNMGTVLSDLGRREEALSSYEKALAIYRPLAERYPDAFGQNLMIVQRNLARLQEGAEQ